jgi:hypothetical protein
MDGGQTLVDLDVADALAGRRLYDSGHGYVTLTMPGTRRRQAYLHHLVCPFAPGHETHHRNHDRRDNRRANLVSLTRSHHHLMHRERRCREGFPGVYRRRHGYRAKVGVGGRKRDTLQWSSPLLAALACDDLLRSLGAPEEAATFAQVVARDRVASLLEESGARFVRVWFVRRQDGRLRDMICRTGVRKGTCGSLAFDPSPRGLISVYDVRARAFRFIPVEGVIALRVRGRSYRVTETPNAEG